jgi:hypothetical protein
VATARNSEGAKPKAVAAWWSRDSELNCKDKDQGESILRGHRDCAKIADVPLAI